jgi:dCTP deaminase
MIKSGTAIRDLLFSEENLKKPLKDRLIITPILDLNEQLNKGSASIDLRLGGYFKFPVRAQIAVLDPCDENIENKKGKYLSETYIDIGDSFTLHPRQFALGQTLEWIHLPNNLCGFIIGRSSWGRDGLIIETASGVHPGYSGPLTLELTNLGEIPIKLYPGLPYSQLFIFDVEQQDLTCLGDYSQFSGEPDITSGNLSNRNMAFLKKFEK